MHRSKIHQYQYFTFVATSPPKSSDSSIDDDELRLINYLFGEGYRKDVRPVTNKTQPVKVTIDLAYTQLIDLVSSFA